MKDTIMLLKECKKRFLGNTSDKFDIAIGACEKQIAKKLDVWANGSEHCPCCESDISYLGFKYCIHCGQKLTLV